MLGRWLVGIAALLIFPSAIGSAHGADYDKVVSLLDTKTTNIGQPLEYPKGVAEITSLTVTLMPGEETG